MAKSVAMVLMPSWANAAKLPPLTSAVSSEAVIILVVRRAIEVEIIPPKSPTRTDCFEFSAILAGLVLVVAPVKLKVTAPSAFGV